MMLDLAPIILFVYNRPVHTQQVLDALAKNKEAKDSLLYIYCDAAKKDTPSCDLEKINQVKIVVEKESRFKKIVIHKQTENKGLAQSIINGVTEVINKHQKAIVLEDDIVVSPTFLNYMNTALNYFGNKKEVFHINGFNNESNLQFFLKDTYFLHFMSCWGWATWKDRWDKIILDHNYFYQKLKANPKTFSKFNYDNALTFDRQLKANIDGKINTWAILWFSTVFFNSGLCLTPKYSMVENIGMDGSGVNCDVTSVYQKVYKNRVVNFENSIKKVAFKETLIAKKHLQLFYKYGSKFNLFDFLKLKLKRVIKKMINLVKVMIGMSKDHLREKVQCNKKWCGNEYGGFYIHPNILDENSIIYSFGIGEDVSFDIDIINQYNAQVFGFDPTPKSINWINRQKLPANFHFYDFGIDIINGKKEFNLPDNDEHVSGSIFNPKHVSKGKKVEVQMRSLTSILKELNHNSIDILKMDIEGSEYDVLLNILDSKIEIGQILVEFHDRFFPEEKLKSKKIVKALQKNGYTIFGVSNSKEEVSFINKKYIVK